MAKNNNTNTSTQSESKITVEQPTSTDQAPLADSALDTPMVLTARQFKEMMVAVVREIKSNPEQEAKDALEKERMERRRLTRVRLARAEIEKRERLQAICNHRKGPNPGDELCIGGQVFSDGIERKICLRCQKIVIEIQAPELTAAASLVKMRMLDKAKDLGIDSEILDSLFAGIDGSAPRKITKRQRVNAGLVLPDGKPIGDMSAVDLDDIDDDEFKSEFSL